MKKLEYIKNELTDYEIAGQLLEENSSILSDDYGKTDPDLEEKLEAYYKDHTSLEQLQIWNTELTARIQEAEDEWVAAKNLCAYFDEEEDCGDTSITITNRNLK